MLLEVVDNFALSELSHVSVMSLVQFKVLSMEILCVLAGKNKVENWHVLNWFIYFAILINFFVCHNKNVRIY